MARTKQTCRRIPVETRPRAYWSSESDDDDDGEGKWSELGLDLGPKTDTKVCNEKELVLAANDLFTKNKVGCIQYLIATSGNEPTYPHGEIMFCSEFPMYARVANAALELAAKSSDKVMLFISSSLQNALKDTLEVNRPYFSNGMETTLKAEEMLIKSTGAAVTLLQDVLDKRAPAYHGVLFDTAVIDCNGDVDRALILMGERLTSALDLYIPPKPTQRQAGSKRSRH